MQEISALNFLNYRLPRKKDGSWELKSQHLEKARAGQAKIHLPAKPRAREPGNKDVSKSISAGDVPRRLGREGSCLVPPAREDFAS